MTGIKRLTPRQSRKVNTLVKKECCNCENGNCILLDDGDTCVCPQTGSRAHEKTARSCYAVRAKKALFYRLLTTVSS